MHNTHGLKQGALSKGSVDHSRPGFFNDVHISKFNMSDKQKGAKEALAKR